MGRSIPSQSQGSAPPVAPGTPPKQQQQVVASHSRRSSPSLRSPSRSHSPSRKPWVSAEWRNRVQESPDSKCSSSAAPTLRAQHRAELIAEKERQLAAEFSIAHETIQRMLARCQLVQDTLQTTHPHPKHSSSNTANGSGNSSSWQPATPQASSPNSPPSGKHMMHLTMRSQLLFEAPATAAAQTHSSGSSSSGAAVAQAAAGAGDVKQQQDRRHSAWDGAVDLNPGFHFRPGTPERAAAVLRHAGSPAAVAGGISSSSSQSTTVAEAAAAAAKSPATAAFMPGLCLLTPRQHLQAGIQELNAVFDQGIRQQQWQQHQQQVQELGQHAAVIPLTWFGPCLRA